MWQGGYTNIAGEILVDNANTKAMLSYVQTRFNDKTMVLPINWEDSGGYGSTHFIAGDICMSVGSTAGIKYNIGDFEVGVAPVPQYDLDHKSAVQQGPNISILSKSTDAERLVAWEYIRYLINAENTAAWAMDTGYLPVRYSGFNSTEYQEFLAIDSITNNRYYSSLAAQAAYLQKDYYRYDPAFAGAYTSSDARTKADVAMSALFAGSSVQAVIDDMLTQLGVRN
jgi:multiple sugar transport system substrate-binding protein